MEKIFLIPGLKKEGLYLTLVQFIFYTIMAKFEMLHKNQIRKIPISTYALLAGATLVTMSLSNASLGKNFSIIWISELCRLFNSFSLIVHSKKFQIELKLAFRY